VCLQCGVAMPSHSRFCGQCGAPADLFAQGLSASTVIGASNIPPAPLAFVASGAGESASGASPAWADPHVQAPPALTADEQPPLRWNDWLIVGGAAAALSLQVLIAAGQSRYELFDLVVLIQGAAIVSSAVMILFAAKRIPSHGRLRYGILAGLGVMSLSLTVLASSGSILALIAGAVVLTGAIAGLIKPGASSPQLQPDPRAWQAQPTMVYVMPGNPASLGAPGIGVAGFVLSILGVPAVGIVLSWVGYAQASREGRRTGLCLAGIIIGFAWLVVLLGLFIVFYVIASRYGSPY